MKFISLLFFIIISLSLFAKNKVIAISYFDNTTGNSKYNSLSKGIADMLITDLSKVRDIDIVEREKLEELIKEIKLGSSSYFDQKTAQKLGKGLGAASILTGSFYVLDGSLRIDARLINVESGKVIAADEVTGSTRDFFSLHKKLVHLLVNSLNVNYNYSTQSVIDYDNKIELTAVVNYSNALTYEDNGLQESASEVLESTIQKYPEFLFAKTKLDKIKEFITEREKERNLLLEQKTNSFLASLDTASETLTTDIMSIWTNMVSSYSYNSILSFNNQLKRKGIPLNTPSHNGSNVTLGEYLTFYDCLALSTLKKHKSLIDPSKYFLSQYPTSIYFNTVKNNLNTSLKELELIEKGKKNVKPLLAYNETYQYVEYLNSLGYHAYRRFVQKEVYSKFKKLYIQKILKADRNTLLLFEPYDRFDDLTEFFEIAEENLDRELMVQIKDLMLDICKDTEQEEDAYNLEELIDDFDGDREKLLLNKEELLKKLNSNDIKKISHAINFLWTIRDGKEDQFIIKWSKKYLELKDNRAPDAAYFTRVAAYGNIVEALNRLGEFDKMTVVIEQYKIDPLLIKNKNRNYGSKLREFKGYLRNGPSEYTEFETKILNYKIKSNILIGKAKIYKENHQYIDQISSLKEIVEKHKLAEKKKEQQHFLLFLAYYNNSNFEEMEKCARNYNELYSDTPNYETIKTMLNVSPR